MCMSKGRQLGSEKSHHSAARHYKDDNFALRKVIILQPDITRMTTWVREKSSFCSQTLQGQQLCSEKGHHSAARHYKDDNLAQRKVIILQPDITRTTTLL